MIRGTRLAAEEIAAGEGELPTKLGATIAWLGGQAMKLKKVSPEEIHAVLPDDIPVNASQPLVVQSGVRLSAPEPLLIVSSWPVVLNAVAPGDGLVAVECTGLGHAVEGAVVEIDGAPARVESVEAVRLGVQRLVVRAPADLPGEVVVNAERRSRPARIHAR